MSAALNGDRLMESTKRFIKWLFANWERVLFIIIGLAFLGACFHLVYVEKVTEAAVIFGLGFLCFLYANVARFKRFKGLGFEAELWEDKQKEAADLIERLKGIVGIYTREIIMNKVTSNRWDDRSAWEKHWELYDELTNQHDKLGQKIDFSAIKTQLDNYFLMDISMPVLNQIGQTIGSGMLQAQEVIKAEFGISSFAAPQSPKIKERMERLDAIKPTIENPFEVVKTKNFAKEADALFMRSKHSLKEDFGVEINMAQNLKEELEKLSALYDRRPLKVTDDLIKLASTLPQ